MVTFRGIIGSRAGAPRFRPRSARRSAVALALATSAVLISSACAGGSGSGSAVDPGEPQQGGILRLTGSSSDAGASLDPQTARSGGDSQLNAQIYERLARPDQDFNLTPELAERWEASPDAKTWTFFLRDGVTFTDGSTFTANDVAATVSRVLDPAVGSPALAGLASSLDATGIRVVDPLTIEFVLKQPNAEFAAALSQRNLAIVKAGTADAARPIGTGPFVVKSFEPGSSWEVERNAGYWQAGLPYLDGVRYVDLPDANQLAQTVQSGSQDLAGLIPATQLATVQASSAVQILTEPSASFMYAVMDPTQAPWDDPRVIEAFKKSIDRQAVINAAMAGSEPTSDVLVSAASKYFPADLSQVEQDTEGAKKLLAEAGYPDGVEMTIDVTDFPAGQVAFATALAEVVKPAGFTLSVNQMDYDAFLSQAWQQSPMYVMYWAARTPLSTLSLLNVSDAVWSEGMSNPELDALVAEAYGTVDESARNALVQQALTVMADEGNQAVPATIPNSMVAANNVHGVEMQAEDLVRLKNTYMN